MHRAKVNRAIRYLKDKSWTTWRNQTSKQWKGTGWQTLIKRSRGRYIHIKKLNSRIRNSAANRRVFYAKGVKSSKRQNTCNVLAPMNMHQDTGRESKEKRMNNHSGGSNTPLSVIHRHQYEPRRREEHRQPMWPTWHLQTLASFPSAHGPSWRTQNKAHPTIQQLHY